MTSLSTPTHLFSTTKSRVVNCPWQISEKEPDTHSPCSVRKRCPRQSCSCSVLLCSSLSLVIQPSSQPTLLLHVNPAGFVDMNSRALWQLGRNERNVCSVWSMASDCVAGVQLYLSVGKCWATASDAGVGGFWGGRWCFWSMHFLVLL